MSLLHGPGSVFLIYTCICYLIFYFGESEYYFRIPLTLFLQSYTTIHMIPKTMLNNSLLTAPNETFPAYTLEGDVVTAYPTTIDANGEVQCQYFRYPKDPKWTYKDMSLVTGGEPVFDGTAADYQDFELPLSDEPNLVVKILEYAGISIREGDVYQFAKTEETQNIQEER